MYGLATTAGHQRSRGDSQASVAERSIGAAALRFCRYDMSSPRDVRLRLDHSMPGKTQASGLRTGWMSAASGLRPRFPGAAIRVHYCRLSVERLLQPKRHLHALV